eukprot:248548-Rhodomonas_salina.1
MFQPPCCKLQLGNLITESNLQQRGFSLGACLRRQRCSLPPRALRCKCTALIPANLSLLILLACRISQIPAIATSTPTNSVNLCDEKNVTALRASVLAGWLTGGKLRELALLFAEGRDTCPSRRMRTLVLSRCPIAGGPETTPIHLSHSAENLLCIWSCTENTEYPKWEYVVKDAEFEVECTNWSTRLRRRQPSSGRCERYTDGKNKGGHWPF